MNIEIANNGVEVIENEKPYTIMDEEIDAMRSEFRIRNSMKALRRKRIQRNNVYANYDMIDWMDSLNPMM